MTRRREDRELWRFGIAGVAAIVIFGWAYVIEPVVKGWGPVVAGWFGW